MSSDLRKIFTDEIIEHYKNNKDLITHELLVKLRSYGNEGKQLALDILDTEKTQDNYYLDAYGGKIAFLGDREIKRPFTKMKLAQIHIEELKKCADDLNYFRENYIKIRTKDGINFPEMRPYQQGFLDALTSEYETIVSLQPRQSGKSVTTAIYMTWLFNFDHDKNMGICANNIKLAKEFLNNVRNMFYGLPMWMRVGVSVWNKGSIESENKMRVLTDSPSENSFRGYTINFLVTDETAFIKQSVFSAFSDSVMPSQSALSWKKNLFISTANGMNHFYEMVKGAKERKTFRNLTETEYNDKVEQYKNIILEKKQNKDGSYEIKIDKPSNGMLFYGVDWRDVPRYNSKGKRLTPEEFREQVIEKYGLVYFQQNYGCEFIGSSYTLLDAEILKTFSASEIDLRWDNRLNVYAEPKKGHKYIMGVDPAKGGIDAFAVQIIDVTTFPWEQVASAQIFKCNYQIMPEFLDEWGRRYNEAFMIIENNEGAGTFVSNMLNLDFEYPNLYFQRIYNAMFVAGKTSREPGFRTNTKTRTQILESMKHFIDNKRLIIHDKETITEFYSFIIINNKYQADDGCHDDMIMSLALCFVPFVSSRNFDDMKDLVKKLYSEEDISDTEFTDYLSIGNFDIIQDEQENLAGKKFDSEFEYSTDYYRNKNW